VSNCLLCALLRIDNRLASSSTGIVGAAHLASTLGEEGFKKTLCASHRVEYDARLPWALKYLRDIADGKEPTCFEPPEPVSTP